MFSVAQYIIPHKDIPKVKARAAKVSGAEVKFIYCTVDGGESVIKVFTFVCRDLHAAVLQLKISTVSW